MVLHAAQALNLTLDTITYQDDLSIKQEITETEQTIRSATQKQDYFARHNAQILGNPVDDVHNDDNLTDLQIEYRDAMIESGYLVSLDVETGYWKFDWSFTGSEQESIVYSIRTSIAVATIAEQTEEAVDAYFTRQEPRVTSKTQVVAINGGDIDEGDFGAVYSEYYEFYSVVTQPDTVDHSAALKTTLVNQGLGYNSTNIAVYKTISK